MQVPRQTMNGTPGMQLGASLVARQEASAASIAWTWSGALPGCSDEMYNLRSMLQ